MQKKLLLVAFVAFVTLFVSCNKKERISVQERGELIVAMDVEMPGYFVLGGESYGYQYDLFKAYADYLGVDLKMVSGNKPSVCKGMLNEGEVDIIATLASSVQSEELESDAVSIYNTSYVLLSRTKEAAEVRKLKEFSVNSFVEGRKLLVSSGFKGSKAYGGLLDSLSNTDIYVSARNSFELIELLSGGEYDFLICEMSEAQLGCAMVGNVEQIYTFFEPISLSAVLPHNDKNFKSDFESWLAAFRGSEEYATLNYLYFEKGIVRQVIGSGVITGPVGGISEFDKIFKHICESEGYDWRLISAIAYSESRFKPNVVSNRGARGLMQIMPRVAKQFNMSGNIMDPEHNVLLAVKILGKIENSLEFQPGTSAVDKIKIIIACYNAGIGHVLDARNLARKYEQNPDSWDVVSSYLSLKSQPEYANDHVVKNGKFNSGQTLAYVKEVLTKYNSYCSNIKR